VIETAPLQRVMDLPRAVRGEDDDGRRLGTDRAKLGYGDLEVRQKLQEEGLEGLVGAVHLVDQQDGRARRMRLQRLQERAADEVGVGEKLGPQVLAVRHARGLRGADCDHLGGEVPLVNRARCASRPS
jgi:hypothetical protein